MALDAFDSAFADAVVDKEPAAPSPAVQEPVQAAPAVQEPVATEIEPLVEGDVEPPIPGATNAPQAQPNGLDDAAVERLLAGLASRVPQPQPQPQQQQPQNYRAPPLVNDEERTFLGSFYQEWPDIARANELMLRVAQTTLTQRIYAEMAAVLKPKLDMIDALATRAQLAYFEAKVPEYDTVAENIGPWVQSQPDYLRNAYLNVMQNGTEDQVLDLITRYQQATGAQIQQQAPPVKQATELSPTAKQAAARLAPVRSTRTTAPAAASATDFDSAFAEAVKSI